MIKSGSHRIVPRGIEEIICELDGVAEATVVGREGKISNRISAQSEKGPL